MKPKHPLYELWRGMIRRCHKRKATGFTNYGGRGIKVCARWRGPGGFENFARDVGARPSPAHTIDRYPNPDGNYEPGNVRWATHSEQNLNRRGNRRLTVGGRTQTLEEWSRETGIPKSTMFNRIRRGWSDEQVVSTAPQPKGADNTLFPAGGRERCIALGLNLNTVASRLRRGWTFDRAISEPVAEQKGGRGNE